MSFLKCCECEHSVCEATHLHAAIVGHGAGRCWRTATVHTVFRGSGLSANLCDGCLTFHTQGLKTKDWQATKLDCQYSAAEYELVVRSLPHGEDR